MRREAEQGCKSCNLRNGSVPPDHSSPHNTRVRQPHTDSAQAPLNRARHVHVKVTPRRRNRRRPAVSTPHHGEPGCRLLIKVQKKASPTKRTRRRGRRAIKPEVMFRSLLSSSRPSRGARFFSSAPHGVTTVGVVGLGLMGHGIAQTAAEKGFSVVAVELEERFLEGGLKRVKDSVQKLASKAVKKGKMDEASAAAHLESVMGRMYGHRLQPRTLLRISFLCCSPSHSPWHPCPLPTSLAAAPRRPTAARSRLAT